MPLNKNTGYGQAQISKGMAATGKTMVVVGTSGAAYQDLLALWTPDNDGVPRQYTTVALALAQTVAGRGDVIITAADYTTSLTAADVLLAETNGVTIIHGGLNNNGTYFCERATATLPQSDPTDGEAIFTVTGKIKLISIQGVVTTAIQNQAMGARLVAVSSVATTSQADLCITGSIAAISVGAVIMINNIYTTNGVSLLPGSWSRTALQNSQASAFLYQIAPVVVQAGTINLCTDASNTGSVKWRIEYEPLEPGARVFAA